MRLAYGWYSISSVETRGLHHYIQYMMTKIPFLRALYRFFIGPLPRYNYKVS
jgi:hypothetical protein